MCITCRPFRFRKSVGQPASPRQKLGSRHSVHFFEASNVQSNDSKGKNHLQKEENSPASSGEKSTHGIIAKEPNERSGKSVANSTSLTDPTLFRQKTITERGRGNIPSTKLKDDRHLANTSAKLPKGALGMSATNSTSPVNKTPANAALIKRKSVKERGRDNNSPILDLQNASHLAKKSAKHPKLNTEKSLTNSTSPKDKASVKLTLVKQTTGKRQDPDAKVKKLPPSGQQVNKAIKGAG